MGRKNLSRIPWAELWMGVNPAGPSRIISPDGKELLLSELIDSDPETFLGKETANTYGKLPFLFKVEAAAKPLSIQAHPNQEQAREGFERENREGIPLDAPNRNYRDPNHKPELSCAITPLAALCGFREAKEISFLIGILSEGIHPPNSEGTPKGGLESLISALEQDRENPLKAFLTALFSLDREALKKLGAIIRSRQPLLKRDFPEYRDEWDLCSYLSGLYPGDPGIIAPLYLNIVELAPGEAMYLKPGVLHASIHGMSVELMADSDNVLRLGLTPKHVDANELLKILDFSEYKPEIFKVPEPAPAWFSFPAPAAEFTLSVMHGSGDPIPYSKTGPSIVIVTKGSATITESGAEMKINTGESVFIPAGEKAHLVFSGTFTAYAASAAGCHTS